MYLSGYFRWMNIEKQMLETTVLDGEKRANLEVNYFGKT